MTQRPEGASAGSEKNPRKDRFDMVAKAVAIIGGLISAVALVISLGVGNAQRAADLRWEQARLASELQDEMLLNDQQAFNALRMTDWAAFDFDMEGEKVRITRSEVQEALGVENNYSLSPRGVFVRENFDRLFYHMGKVERALRSGLVRFEDVCSPMDYYVPFLRSTHGSVLIPYMEQLHHTDALAFMRRFESGPECAPPVAD